MERLVIAVVAGLVGGAAGGLAVHFTARSARSADAPAADDAALREIRDALAAMERRMDPPGLATTGGAGGTTAPGTSAGAPSGAAPGDAALSSRDARRVTLTADEVKALVAEATEAALEKHAAKEKAVAKAEERKKATLAEVSRELALSAAQENEIRAAYHDATEKYLKLMAEPEQTPDDLRRELEAAKGDSAKKSALTVKYMPKIMAKLGEVMAVETEKEERVKKAVGPEKLPAFRKYRITDSDPFGMDDDGEDGSISIGVTSGN